MALFDCPCKCLERIPQTRSSERRRKIDADLKSPMFGKVHDLPLPAATTSGVEDMTNRVGHKMNTVLVVEDNEDIRRMLIILLESEGFHVLEAASGGDALKVVKDGRPDVILMDLALPGIDGLETIRRIRKIDGFQNTPIIVLTAYSGRSVYETAVRAGTNYFMSKPIDFDELATLVQQVLSEGDRRAQKNSRSFAKRAVIMKASEVSNVRREMPIFN